MPVLESPPIIIPSPVRQLTALTLDRYSAILSADKVYYSLKGPPPTQPSELSHITPDQI
jgi:hypothetical protein